MSEQSLPLPVDLLLPQILASLKQASSLVLQASPGSGKTTRVPAAFMKSLSSSQEVLVLEPRRLAAELAARRVAHELGGQIGEEVGFQFRFENRTSARTRLRFLTEGMLMKRLLQDPLLKSVAAVFLDEFHERHLHGDVALSYLRWLQQNGRPDLKIIVMSATLDVGSVSAYLVNAPILQIDAPVHSLEIVYLPSAASSSLEGQVKKAVNEMLTRQKEGDILVFLPGMAEIRRVQTALSSSNVQVKILHGDLSREEQDEAILESKTRKVILSTNVAESSVTLPGVRAVIDSGLHRMARYSWWSGVPSLKTRPVSRASAIQRAGRAARVAPGICMRLYTKGDFDSRPAFETPEILRADLSQTILELAALGFHEPEKFPWFEAPALTSIQASRQLLVQLGALDFSGKITEMGRRINSIPTHPRIARMLCEAHNFGCLEDATTLAVLMGEGDLEDMDAFRQLASARRDPRYRRVRNQLESSSHLQRPASRKGDLAQAVLTGFPDRVAKKRVVGNSIELLFSSGGSAVLENSAFFQESEFFVVLDAQEKQGMHQARSTLVVKSLCSINPDGFFDLENSLLRDHEEVSWNSDRKRVEVVSQIKYDQLILSESEVKDPPVSLAIQRLLLKMSFGVDIQSGAGALEPLCKRLEILGHTLTPEWIEEKVLETLEGRLSLPPDFDLASEIFQRLDPDLQRRLDKETPEFFLLPNTRRVKIQYQIGKSPWIESRLQDFFGVKSNPAIANGRVPLVLHLLAPNQRALQVTEDLPGFWKRTYAEVRRELMRRYPRHAWPEDPTQAEPIAPKPRR